ncbi:hypothetical protein VT84_21750 [Gemmata sp. SH-PL17]|uniref:hypothetical protein n=1 Tax=Gemmata sp. SH-PL17 TaxID=1630693 RepID=UPI00078B5920|nr:hypothetical protein [Gemmata sp. SH-PL17]AMV27042.1 hypothetical protein VT84_21750 [Gemmata sp. SH-PL17]
MTRNIFVRLACLMVLVATLVGCERDPITKPADPNNPPPKPAGPTGPPAKPAAK